MTRTDWDDARLNAAFRARFGSPGPATLFEHVHERLETAGPAGTGRAFGRTWFPWRLAAPLLVAAVAFVFVVGSLIGSPTPSPSSSAVDATQSGVVVTPAPTDASGPIETFNPIGEPPPVTINVPGTDGEQPVLTVTQALERPAGEPTDREIVVGGWYSFIPVPCAAIPDPTSELESCAADFTWLMEEPQAVSAGIRPTGPAINIVTALTDWQPPTGNAPVAMVVSGHFEDRRAGECPTGDRQARCRALFVVDAPLWLGRAITPAAVPATVFDIPVGNVADALRSRDRLDFAAEIALAGWYNAPSRFSCFDNPQWLLGNCENADRWLMADPEQLLIDDGTTETHLTPKGDAFQVAFATTPWPSGNAIPDIGQRVPIPVVFVGHFHDRRVFLCEPSGDQTVQDAWDACGARFVVDAVAWANGTDREPQVSDWRDSEGLPFPDVDVAAIVHDKFADGIILNQTLISGASGLPLYQPSIASLFPGLASEDSLWAVTVLRPGLRCVPDQACPAMFKPDSVIDLVIGPDGRVYEDPEFHTMPLLPGMTPYPPGS